MLTDPQYNSYILFNFHVHLSVSFGTEKHNNNRVMSDRRVTDEYQHLSMSPHSKHLVHSLYLPSVRVPIVQSTWGKIEKTGLSIFIMTSSYSLSHHICFCRHMSNTCNVRKRYFVPSHFPQIFELNSLMKGVPHHSTIISRI